MLVSKFGDGGSGGRPLHGTFLPASGPQGVGQVNLSPKRAADPHLVCNDRHMLGLIGFLLVVWFVFALLGLVVKGRLWLATIGIVLFVAPAGWRWTKRNARA